MGSVWEQATERNAGMETVAIQEFKSGLSPERHAALAGEFNPILEGANALIAESRAITVKGVSDVAGMRKARAARLKLKDIRVAVEKKRKELKEASLREGKAIDGMANIAKFVIVPAEESLQEKEDFVKREQEKVVAAMVEDRTGKLMAFEVDCQHFDLAGMTEEAFAALLSTSEMGHKAKKQAEEQERQRIEAEREKAEKEAEEREKTRRDEMDRIAAENAKLQEAKDKADKEAMKADAARLKAEAETERVRKEAKDKADKEAREQAEKERAEKEAELARVKDEKEAEQARLAAPDKDKLTALDAAICALSIPSVSSDVALETIQETRELLNSAVKRLRVGIAAMKGKQA